MQHAVDHDHASWLTLCGSLTQRRTDPPSLPRTRHTTYAAAASVPEHHRQRAGGGKQVCAVQLGNRVCRDVLELLRYAGCGCCGECD